MTVVTSTDDVASVRMEGAWSDGGKGTITIAGEFPVSWTPDQIQSVFAQHLATLP